MMNSRSVHNRVVTRNQSSNFCRAENSVSISNLLKKCKVRGETKKSISSSNIIIIYLFELRVVFTSLLSSSEHPWCHGAGRTGSPYQHWFWEHIFPNFFGEGPPDPPGPPEFQRSGSVKFAMTPLHHYSTFA